MRLTLSIAPQTLAIFRLAPDAQLPMWATRGALWSITRTADELSVVAAPEPSFAGPVEDGWRAFKVRGPLAFTLTGVIAALTVPLAAAAIGVFVLSTFDTDYILVKADDLARATEALIAAGHEVLQ